MIKNQREYLITKGQAAKFRDSLAHAQKAPRPTSVHPKLHKASIEGMRAHLQELEGALREYEQLHSARGRKRIAADGLSLGVLLIKARIARGWSQRALGERLGLHMQKIQQYEATEYASASLTRLQQVLQALGVELSLRGDFVQLPDGAAPAKPKRVAVASRTPLATVVLIVTGWLLLGLGDVALRGFTRLSEAVKIVAVEDAALEKRHRKARRLLGYAVV